MPANASNEQPVTCCHSRGAVNRLKLRLLVVSGFLNIYPTFRQESTEDHYRVADDPPRGALALEVVGVIAIYQQLLELAQMELGGSFRLPD